MLSACSYVYADKFTGKQASIFICQMTGYQKAIGSTMLAAYSNSTNSKKSAHTENKKLTSWPLHADITLQ